MRIVSHVRSLDHTSQIFPPLGTLKIYHFIDLNTCISYVQRFSQISPIWHYKTSFQCHQVKNISNKFAMFART